MKSQNTRFNTSRLNASAGIAIGPILFVIFILGIIATAFSSSSSVFTSAVSTDKISSDIVVQTNLIKSAVSSCRTRSILKIALSRGNPGEACLIPSGRGYPVFIPYAYPSRGLIRDLVCSPLIERVNDSRVCEFLTDSSSLQNFSIWKSEGHYTVLPPPPKGFKEWEYINAESDSSHGGICAWIAPENPEANNIIEEGLKRAAAKFNSLILEAGDSAGSMLAEAIENKKEVVLDVSSKKFIIWLLPPESSAHTDCLP